MCNKIAIYQFYGGILKENCKIGKYLLMFSIKYQCKLGTIGRHDGDLQEALMFLAL